MRSLMIKALWISFIRCDHVQVNQLSSPLRHSGGFIWPPSTDFSSWVILFGDDHANFLKLSDPFLRWYWWEKECLIDISTEHRTLNNIVVSFNAHLFSSSCESLFIKCENRQYKHLSIYFIFSFFHRITCRSHGKLEEELFSINPLHDLLGCFISSSIVLDALFAYFFPPASAAVKFCSATYKFSSWQKKTPHLT